MKHICLRPLRYWLVSVNTSRFPMKHLWISDETHLSQNTQVLVGFCQHLCISDKTHLSQTTQMRVGLCQHLCISDKTHLSQTTQVWVGLCQHLCVSDKTHLSQTTQVLVHIITSFSLTVHICVKPAIEHLDTDMCQPV